MYKSFNTLEDLYREIEEDKHWIGAESALRNRYPIRFVLFERFEDFYDFVTECGNHGVFMQSIEKWMESEQVDNMLTYSQLADRFKDYVKGLPAHDYVIAPFSEIARFYDNQKYREFETLMTTIRLIEAPEEAQRTNQRIYVPIIGMGGKVAKFKNDANIAIWEYQTGNNTNNYRVILTKSTYGVKGLDQAYSLCHNMREWVSLWKEGNKVRPQIICTSKALYDHARNAQPDNAFDYVTCHDAFEFLTKGLTLDLGKIEGKPEEEEYWEELASQVNVSDFHFEQFVAQRFNVLNLIQDASKFVDTWFNQPDNFPRWLLKTYYLKQGSGNYLQRCLQAMRTLSTSELFSLLATMIFDEPHDTKDLSLRARSLKEAAMHKVRIAEMAEQKVKAKLMAMGTSPDRGYYIAMKYMTALTRAEHELAIEWLGKGHIQRDQIKHLFPDLYYYTEKPYIQLSASTQWVNDYLKAYVKSKISNAPSDDLTALLKEKNANEVTFEGWRNHFKTVKTILHNRKDIDVYYWIDGLGVDWIPFIASLVEKHNVEGVYLNEVYIATAELPTTTAVNKKKLEELAGDNLKKIGDLDSFAHTQKEYPTYIMDEMALVEDTIHRVLSQYNGKKIAFVSDHGISYMAGHKTGLNLAGITPNHQGRCACWEKGNAPHDNNYIILPDGKAICSLTHHSLSAKVPLGQGAHGGATPEEVLVPIIVVSGQKNASNYSAKLMNNDILASNPVLQYTIKGLNSIDCPIITYNGVEYRLNKVGGDLYESEHLNLMPTATTVTLKINDFQQTDYLNVNMGAQEDDLFNF